MNDSTLLDLDALDRLERLGGAAFVARMIGLFGSYGGEKIAAARKAHDAGDLKALQEAVHPIRSSAGNVGAVHVQDLARQIEQLAEAHQTGHLPPLMAELESAFARARHELEHRKPRGTQHETGPGNQQTS